MKTTWYSKVLSEKYYDIKERVSKLHYAKYAMPLDEDIFHDTLILADKTISKTEVIYEKLIGYLHLAYTNNFLRELSYACNRHEVVVEELPDVSPDVDKSEYFQARNEVEAYVNKHYGKKVFEAFAAWLLDGMSIAQLEKKTKIKGLKYKFNKIRKYIVDTYDKNILYDIKRQTDDNSWV